MTRAAAGPRLLRTPRRKGQELPADEGQISGPARPDEEDLSALLRAFQRGERGSFERLYARLWGPVALRAGRMGLTGQEAEEVAQNVLVRVYLYAPRGRFEHAQQAWAWVYTITRREVYKLWGAHVPETASGQALEVWASQAADPSDGPPAAAAAAEVLEDVGHCIARLEKDERTALLGVLVGGLTFRGAAEAYGLSLGQFKHRYQRALGKVRECMRAKGHAVDGLPRTGRATRDWAEG